MDARLIIELISAVGFPITACLLLGWFIFKIYKKGEEREAALRIEIEDCQEVNKEAIKTLALYAERLGIIENDVKEIKEDIIVLTDRTSHNN